MEELALIQRIAVWVIPVLFAITLHEVAHGWMARRLGDPTAMMMGRLTINPLKHIDPMGTVLVPALMLTFGGFLFGWAKPVPITWENLRQPKRDIALVAIAGPLSNLLMALFWVLVIRLGLAIGSGYEAVALYILYTGVAGVVINTILMLFNLLPLPPLDGGRVMVGILPGPLSWQLSRIEPYGLPILILLLLTGILGKLVGPVVMFAMSGFIGLSGLSSQGFRYIFTTLMG